jgi:predicted dehydrogenase
MKLTGFNFIICGSSKITDLHIKTIKRIKGCNIKYIYAENYIRRNYLAKKYHIPVCKSLKDPVLQNCNVALISNSTSKHFYSIVRLSKYINYFIVEKPIVSSNIEFDKLKKIFAKKEAKLKEVSQYLFCKKIKILKFPKKKCSIIVRKNRKLDDYKNYDNSFDVNKSIVMTQFPHWLDLINYFSKGKLCVDKILNEKSDNTVPFSDKVNVFFKDKNSKNIQYNIDVSCAEKKNYPSKILLDNKTILLDDNILKKYVKKFFYKFTKLKIFAPYQDKIFYLMYLSFLKYFKNKKKNTYNNQYFQKTKLLNKIKTLL